MAINTLSTPNRLGNNGSRFYSFASRPVMIEAQFKVAATDTGGLGITGLTGQGVNTVFMYTSATAGAGPNGVTNPLTASASQGFIWMQLANNYKNLLSVGPSFVSPSTGSTVNIDASDAALVAGTPYMVNSLGTSTTADWQAVGLPLGLTPTVGQSFVAIATGAGTGTGNVKAVGVSKISEIEIVGTPGLSFWPTPTGGISPNVGAWVMLQLLAPSVTMSSYTPAGTNNAPALTMNSYTPAGTNNSATPPIFTGTPATLTGTVAAPTFTGTPATLTGTVSLGPVKPNDGSLVYLSLYVAA